MRVLLACAAALSLFLSNTSVEARAVKERIKLPEPLLGRIKQVVDDGEELHRICLEAKREKTLKKLDKIRRSLKKSGEFTFLAREHRVHLERNLLSLRSQLDRIRDVNSPDYKSNLQEVFRQLLQLAKSYEVPHKYNYFFCGIDKTSWYQAGKAPRNPVTPEGRAAKCGTMMQ